MLKKSARACFVIISTLFVLSFILIAPVRAQNEKYVVDEEGGVLYARFRAAIKAKCGERGEALRLGKLIIEKYANDELNKEVVAHVRKKTAEIEKEDANCRRYDRYNRSFTAKNWQEFFAAGKAVIAEDGDSRVALDVMLDLVSIGFDQAAVNKIDKFNDDTLRYAKLSIQQIEAGQTSKNGRYGAVLPFSTKEEALSWMNYITGWFMYYKMNRRKEALPYFYKATQIGNAKKNDTTIYTNIGSYYFDEAVRIESEYREKKKAGKYQETDETKALLTLARGTAERAMFYFARAYKIAAADPKLVRLKDTLRKTINDLYRFRLNLNPDYEPDELELFIDDLTSQPLPDLKTPPAKPVLDEPVEIRLRRNRLQ